MTAPDAIVSFDEFYRAQNRRLFQYFRKRVGGDAAPDLVQEAFTRMLRCGAFDRAENPQAYLTRTAHNLVIERARWAIRKESGVCLFDDDRDAAVQPEQEWRFEAKELRRAYRRALLAMPRKTRRIFLAHRLGHLTYAEIAEQFGISIKTVENHMTRALARCRKAAARYA